MSQVEGTTRRSLIRNVLLLAPVLIAGPILLSTEEIIAALPRLLNEPKDLKNMTALEKAHVPQLGMPPIAEDGAVVPTYIELDHPMEPDHYIKSATVLFYGDPIVNKGTFHFTPLNGKPWLSTFVRIGNSGKVICISECNKHGKWVGYSEVKVTVGGC